MRLVYFSPVPWHSFTQRPHQFVNWFHARTGAEVLWLEPYPTRLPMLADLQRKRPGNQAGSQPAMAKATPEWLSILSPRPLPIEPLPGSGLLNRWLWNGILQAVKAFVDQGECWLGIGKPSELALQVLARHPGIPSVYDAMDDFPAFYQGWSRAAMAERERKIVALVSRLLVSSTLLASRFAGHHAKWALTLNACETSGLPPATLPNRPDKPVLGYVGTIGHWFDWPLVVALAQANPAFCIRLIGPVYSTPPTPLPGNIELLAACDHAAAIRAMQEFSVGLIPFKCTDLTASVDPIKFYEYRALGLPVLSTRFGEMARRSEEAGVFFLDGAADLVSQVKDALSYGSGLSEIAAFRAANSWATRFDASGILV